MKRIVLSALCLLATSAAAYAQEALSTSAPPEPAANEMLIRPDDVPPEYRKVLSFDRFRISDSGLGPAPHIDSSTGFRNQGGWKLNLDPRVTLNNGLSIGLTEFESTPSRIYDPSGEGRGERGYMLEFRAPLTIPGR